MNTIVGIRRLKTWRWRPSAFSFVLAAVGPVLYGLSLLSVVLFTDVGSFAWIERADELWSPLLYSVWISSLTCLICALLSPLVAGSFCYLQGRLHALNRPVMTQWMLLPYCLPTVLVGGMMVLTFGNSGLINHIWSFMYGDDKTPLKFLYRDGTPLLGTVWMNLSFGVLLLLKQWQKIPRVLWFQVKLFQLSQWGKFKKIILPYTLAVFLPWLLLVFLSCFSSFGLMLMLSGSPRATTLELASWQSLFLEGDWSKGAAFMVVQLLSSFALVLSVWLLTRAKALSSVQELGFDGGVAETGDESRPLQIGYKKTNVLSAGVAFFLIGLFFLFYLAPALALLSECYSSLRTSSQPIQWAVLGQASWQSLQNASGASLVAVVMVFVLVANERRALHFTRPTVGLWFQLSTWLPLVVPGMCVSFGLMALTYYGGWDMGKRLAVWLIQALSALPIAVALFRFGWNQNLAASAGVREELGIQPLRYFLVVEWPAMFRWCVLVMIATSVLSMSDVTVVSLLSDPAEPVLTLVIAQLMGSYQFAEASLASGLLLILSLGGVLLLSTSTASVCFSSLKVAKNQKETSDASGE